MNAGKISMRKANTKHKLIIILENKCKYFCTYKALRVISSAGVDFTNILQATFSCKSQTIFAVFGAMKLGEELLS
jgi:hypothetical protein